MSAEEDVREPYRLLTEREREILELLLTVDVEGIEALRQQVPYVRGARWNCGCASFNHWDAPRLVPVAGPQA